MKINKKIISTSAVALAVLAGSVVASANAQADTVYRNFNSATGEHLYASYNEW
ncbi:hypothetical protein [Lactococcus termiticola]|uniref:Uncharacterized protein n=1 Tax=Lactococcus termiticola TaxID=2169526 RepID=A0A2R5HH13_9LACT|nr:hypothetical protein [Lactococcus termiticola]GBG97146.1 hypothetical protein NtB2_01283 [Lactococcus termiticola]